MNDKNENRLKKPEWLKIKLRTDGQYNKVNETIESKGLHTICTSGSCPNKNECFSRGTATLMLLGNICTRHCKFCNVEAGRPLPPDESEPLNIATTIKELGLKHCVLTSVDRDDLTDFGATHWAETINYCKRINPNTTIEALIPDFDGNYDLLQIVACAKPDILSHNIETVRRLTPILRSKAEYDRSLKVLKYIDRLGIKSKTGIMLGVGETREEVIETMDDVLNANCNIMTIGQYLQPTRKNYPVQSYIHPDEFNEYKEIGLKKGFRHIESGPMVRSSYFAEKHIL